MSHPYFLTHLLSILLLSTFGLASPLSGPQELAERDNKWNLKCSNAPTVVAGSFLNVSDVTKPLPKDLPESGSNQPWFKYLWCVPGTKTYLFLDNGRLEPPPLTSSFIHYALLQAAAEAKTELAELGDGPITPPYNGYMTPDYSWAFTVPATNTEVQMQSSKGVLTRGIMVSAWTGLLQYADDYNMERMPMVFQVNDGQWGEVAIGYVGYIDPDDPKKRCVYQNVQGDVGYCEDVAGGKVIN